MKNTIKLLTLALVLFISTAGMAQGKKVTEEKIKVSGLCEMCKERIEAALDRPGVKFAEWDIETNMLSIAYRTDKLSEKELHQCIADAGHDTSKVTATEAAYNSLHMCCRYRDESVRKDHDKDDKH